MHFYEDDPADAVNQRMNQIRDDPGILNNFCGWLPYGFGRDAVLEAVTQEGEGPEAYRELFNRSKKLGDRSLADFLNDINVAIMEAGISLDEIERLQQCDEYGIHMHYDDLVKLTLPVTESLLRQGYTLLMLQS
jgi:hypothetical protein